MASFSSRSLIPVGNRNEALDAVVCGEERDGDLLANVEEALRGEREVEPELIDPEACGCRRRNDGEESGDGQGAKSEATSWLHMSPFSILSGSSPGQA